MNIYILTFHAVHNYGAILQALAIQEHLSSQGYEIKIIDYRSKRVDYNNFGVNYWSGLKQFVRGISRYRKPKKKFLKYRAFEKFKKAHYFLTPVYREPEELGDSRFEKQVIVFGSDQIWNCERGVSEVYCGRYFVESAIRIAYAPSFGTDRIPDRARKPLTKFLSDFDKISVRENSGSRILGELDLELGEIPVVLDPTLLLSWNEWEKYALPMKETGHIFVYCMKPTLLFEELLRHLRAEHPGKRIILFGSCNKTLGKIVDHYGMEFGPGEFLTLINQASLVVSDSFHGTAFSVNFEKPLICIPHETRNERMSSLLTNLGCENHQLGGIEEIEDVVAKASFTQEAELRSRLDRLRSSSREYLKKALADLEK
ncbi:polysaccharide pyruvyl transferase family protein [Akkermansiaceae bacterium]|nr:polysaccharide pyruvyl transferase family protein [Akkermansiaceae bacterium]MDA7518637.1 polysaccharide pyruvyl transferase family protein [Akkermansiaceae bacterium]MDA7674804.1 polysaccharide pyruvyl transferase family protein [Akkermansiaceae bacterium]MDB4041085.1 polysaccharide pyruvyl transferase family protein [Akkermansiaceae bacterium]MDB4305799.1 polysaccharide pyruvyl transferase family protein [Akkermansiaceae bacterium]